MEIHIAWFIANFCPGGGMPNAPVFVTRNGAAVDIESVRITAGQIKRAAGLQAVRTCIAGLSVMKVQRKNKQEVA